MIVRNRRNNGDVGIDDIGCVPESTHPDFHDGDLDRRIGEGGVCHHGKYLEEAEPRPSGLL